MLIEREASLQLLQNALRLCRSGRGQTVIVGGEAGIGKSSLLREFALKAEGVKVLWGGSDALFSPRPLGPLHDMAAELGPRVAQLLDEMAPQERIFPALLNVLQGGRELPMLILEDVHWADDATLDLIKYLGRRISFMPAMLVLSFRQDEVGADHSLAQVLGDLPAGASTRIMLKPLSVQGIAALAQSAGWDAGELHRISAGNPFFATELLANSYGAEGIPASVRDAVWARVQRLAEKERSLLEAISIAPSGAENWFAAELLGENADAAIDNCVVRGLLVKDNEGRYRFRHELARAATLERLSPAAQKLLHQRAYAALAVRPSFPLPCLVHHAAGAGDAEKVLALAPRAAEEAIKLGAHREAAAFLATAVAHSAGAPPELVAQIYENLAYVEGISLKIGDPVINAAKKSTDLWRGLGRKDKVSHNLRWLSRLHWFRGEATLAVRYADEAIDVLSGEPPCRELAMALSNRAQLFMFNDRFEEAASWSRNAIELADELGEIETRIHALNNLGGSMLFAGNAEGKVFMEESLALALKHGFNDQADRAYANYAEYAVLAKDFDLAERIIAEGIAFNSKHDLDAGVHLLLGRKAQLRMEQGRLAEAETIAAGILGLDGLALVGKLPALIVLAKTRLRLGKEDGQVLMRQALQDALATQEQQNIVPARLGMVEAAWLQGDLVSARAELEAMLKLHLEGLDSWDLGSLAAWWKRCAMTMQLPGSSKSLAPPREAELRGDCEAAATEWLRLGLPYEAALSLMAAPAGLAKAAAMFEELNAAPAAARAREAAKAHGIAVKAARRGPYSIARQHPLGLTGREADVLNMLAQGLGNHEIARRIQRSPRTVEHHVSALLGKLNATSRMDVMLRLRNEPWLLAAGQN